MELALQPLEKPATELSLKLPSPKFYQFWNPHRPFKAFVGGRGGGKSETIAQCLVLEGCRRPIRVLCLRHHAITLQLSFKAALEEYIAKMGLNRYYRVLHNSIRGVNAASGTEFKFMGLDKNPLNIKSAQDIDYFVIEEAQQISRSAWTKVIPTARKDGVQIIVMMNPENEDDPVYEDFVVRKLYEDETIVIRVNYDDNIYFPETLEMLRQQDLKNRTKEYYEHVWLGEPNNVTDATVFHAYEPDTGRGIYQAGDLSEYVKEDSIPLYGLDWGLVSGLTVLTKSYILDNVPDIGLCLYVAEEASGFGVSNRTLVEFCSQVSGAVGEGNAIISDVQIDANDKELIDGGLRLIPAHKGMGSIDDGVRKIQQHDRVVINPSCENMFIDIKRYKHKIDRHTEKVLLGKYEDSYNDSIDALRYSLEGQHLQERLYSRMNGSKSAIELDGDW